MRITIAANAFVGTIIAALGISAAFAQVTYDINQIQRALVTHGYNIGSIDGLWGRRSINALAAFQKAYGLRATGELNDVTVKRLLKSPQPQAATPVLPPTTFPAIGTPSPTSSLLPIPTSSQAVMVEQTLPAPLSESASPPLGSAVPSAVISPPKVISMSISSQSLEAIRAGALAAGAVAIAIAVIFLFVRRRHTIQIVRNASASSTGHVSIATNTRLSPPPTSKSSGAHPEVNQPIKSVTSNVQISPDLTASIAAHNAKVEKALTARLAEDAGLVAELVAQASTPGRATDWMKRLKDLEATDSERVADILVAAAAADGRIDPSEVPLLEKVFARLGLEASASYTRLHGSIAVPTGGPDDDLSIVLPAGKAPKTESISPPPPVDSGGRAVHVDLSRLETIRRETRSASNVLADIFAEEEDTPEPEAIAQAVSEPRRMPFSKGLRAVTDACSRTSPSGMNGRWLISNI